MADGQAEKSMQKEHQREKEGDDDPLSIRRQTKAVSVSEKEISNDGYVGFFERFKALITRRNPNLRQDISQALQQTGDGVDNSAFSEAEKMLLRNLLNLRHKRLEDVMVPRAEIVALDESQTVGELIAKFADVAHSRIPIYAETLDDVRGMVHIKDLMRAAKSVILPIKDEDKSPQDTVSHYTSTNGDAVPFLKKPIAQMDILRRVAYVPPSMEVQNLLQTMQATRLHMAIVVDEYGGTDGLVTIEDLIETVVGDIEDEHDEAELNMFRKISETEFVVDARIELDDLNTKMGQDIRMLAPEEEADTLGGFVFGLVDRVPVRGECIAKLRGFEFEIIDADPRRIKRIKIVKRRKGVRSLPEGARWRSRSS